MCRAYFVLTERKRCRELGALPLPVGERVGVRGIGTIDNLQPLTRRTSAFALTRFGGLKPAIARVASNGGSCADLSLWEM